MGKKSSVSEKISEQLFLKVFELSTSSLIIKADAPHYTIIAVGNVFLESFSVNREEIIDKSFSDIIKDNGNSISVSLLKHAFDEIIITKKKVAVQFYSYKLAVAEKKDARYWSAENIPILGDDGEVSHIIHTPVNITEQVISKQKDDTMLLNLQIQQGRMNELFMKAPVGMTFLSKDNFIIEYANYAICEMWNRGGPDVVIGKPAFEVAVEVAEFRKRMERVIRTGIPFIANNAPVLLNRNNKAETYYFDLIFDPLRDSENQITGIIGIAVEVTEQVQARRKLEDAEERLRLATEATGLGTWDLDLKTSVIIHSPRLAEIFGRASDVIMSQQDFQDFIHPDDVHIVLFAFKRALQTGKYFYEVRVIWPDGSTHWIRNTGRVIYDDQHQPLRMLGTVNDVTGQRNLIDELKASEENLRLATQAAELGTFDMDLIKGTMDWDTRCRELFGIYSYRPVSYEQDFLPALHPDDRDRVAKIIGELMDKELSNGDYNVEYRAIGLEDNKTRWIKARGKVVFDENDLPLRFMGAVLDITENKLDEIRKNDFIAMASHELKTPLTSLKSYIQLLLLKAQKSKDEFLLSSLQKSENQINKMTGLIYGFLDLSKIESGKLELDREMFDINELIKEVIADNIPIALDHTFAFESDKPVRVNADREKIGQVLTNFISNAVKYSPKGSEIIISSKTEEKAVRVTVKDQGIGIGKKYQKNIFERFYRVEDESTRGFSGFGIGLYISAEIIQLHYGKIGVKSEEDKGASFYFTLPMV